jgi:hypothetical protein
VAAAQGAGGTAPARGRSAGPRHAQRLRVGLLHLLVNAFSLRRQTHVRVLLDVLGQRRKSWTSGSSCEDLEQTDDLEALLAICCVGERHAHTAF